MKVEQSWLLKDCYNLVPSYFSEILLKGIHKIKLNAVLNMVKTLYLIALVCYYPMYLPYICIVVGFF